MITRPLPDLVEDLHHHSDWPAWRRDLVERDDQVQRFGRVMACCSLAAAFAFSAAPNQIDATRSRRGSATHFTTADSFPRIGQWIATLKEPHMPLLLIALFFVAHGIVHPILAVVPSRDESETVGGLWTSSWLLGRGPIVKQLIWIGSVVTFVLFASAALSTMGWILPQGWWRPLTILAAGSSLLVLVVFWFRDFFIGVVIDVALLIVVLVANWSPVAAL
jgi:hypothetical protein